MNRHHLHRRSVLAVVLIRIKGYVLEIFGKAVFFGFVSALVEFHALEQLVDVLQTILVLILPVHLFQPALIQDPIQKIRDKGITSELGAVIHQAQEFQSPWLA